MCAVITVIFGVCNSVRLSLFVVTFCMCSINPITNQIPFYSHFHRVTTDDSRSGNGLTTSIELDWTESIELRQDGCLARRNEG
jgi:hypothetical protein